MRNPKAMVGSFLLVCLMTYSSLAETANYEKLVSGNNKHFTPLLFKQVAKENPNNFLICPISLEVVLSLAQSGAIGETGKEIRQVLGLPEDQSSINTGFKHLLEAITKSDADGFGVKTANKLFVKQSLTPKDAFRNVAVDFYSSGIDKIDFAKTEEAVETINSFVAEATQNKIKDLVSPNVITADTAMVLVNALYLKGRFKRRFVEANTKKEDFHVSKTKTVQTDLMTQTNPLGYKVLPEIQTKVVEIPFVGNQASLVVAVPDDIEGIKNIEDNIDKILDVQLDNELLHLYLPKFKIETSLLLKPILQNLGIQKAFNQEADLSGIAGKKGDLYVSDVVQKTYIKVEENGVEAAAASAGMVMTRVRPIAVAPEILRVDRPFIYFIKVKGVVAFVGKIVDPTSG